MATTKHASIRYEVLDKYLQKESEDNTQAILVNAVAMPLLRETQDMRVLKSASKPLGTIFITSSR